MVHGKKEFLNESVLQWYVGIILQNYECCMNGIFEVSTEKDVMEAHGI